MALLERGVAGLAALEPDSLSLEQLKELALEAEQAAGRLRGIASRALGEIDALQPEGLAWWWRDSLSITGEAAGVALRRARGLRDLPAISEAVVEGGLSLEQAGALTPLVGKLSPDRLQEMQPELLDESRRRSVDGISQWVRLLIATNSEADLEAQAVALEDKRGLYHRQCQDGMIRGRFALTPEDAEPFLTVLEPLARRTSADDTRTAAQRRADAMVEVFEGSLRWSDLPQAGGQRAQLSYVMTADWAAGLVGASPAEAAWTGPQTRGRIESVGCDARLSRVLLDADGQVVSLLALNEEISRGQRIAVSARDRCCTVRGCTRPPAFCDVHHLRSRRDGGPTVLGNLVLLCRRHHVLWHKGLVLWGDLRIPWYVGSRPRQGVGDDGFVEPPEDLGDPWDGEPGLRTEKPGERGIDEDLPWFGDGDEP
jgi:hypothetical protein